jgi:hypothetical protein
MSTRIICSASLVLGLFVSVPAFSQIARPTAAPMATATKDPAAGAGTGATSAPVRKIDWKAMDTLERKLYMKKVVVPAMQKVFARFDPQKYEKVTCYLCHGDGVGKDYKMPNPALTRLPTELAAWKVLQDKKPEATQFMATQVKPRMAALLGREEWTQAHQDGFGCYDCHTKVGGAGAAATTGAAAR